MRVEEKNYKDFNDERIVKYTLTNKNNLSIKIISYGATLMEFVVPDKNGKFENITVNVNSVEEVKENRPFHGAIIGPVAGRISEGYYIDRDKKIKLTKNEGQHTLHGGNNGLDTKNWKGQVVKKKHEASVTLSTTLKDLEDGFPGNIEVFVTYTLNDNNELIITYTARTDKRTIFNPTNHVYFNLNGNKNNKIYNHFLKINSKKYSVLDSENIPTGELKSVNSTIFDLQKGEYLSKIIESTDEQIRDRKGIDHPFVLNNESNQSAVTLLEENTGRKIEVFTDADAVVIYSHNHEHLPLTGEENRIEQHSGIAIETSSLPNTVNQKEFGSIWLEKNQQFSSFTCFKFEILN